MHEDLSIDLMRHEVAKHLCRTKGTGRAPHPNSLYISIFWECEGSPTGYCAYDKSKDPAMDQCLFCGNPHERK